MGFTVMGMSIAILIWLYGLVIFFNLWDFYKYRHQDIYPFNNFFTKLDKDKEAKNLALEYCRLVPYWLNPFYPYYLDWFKRNLKDNK